MSTTNTSSRFVWVILVGFCFLGLTAVVEVLRRVRREEASLSQGTAEQRQPFWKIPKVLGAALLVGYGAHGLLADDVWLPARASAIHLHGSAARFFLVTTFCTAAFVAADVLKYYAGQGAGRVYTVCMCITAFLAWSFLGLSFAVSLLQ